MSSAVALSLRELIIISKARSAGRVSNTILLIFFIYLFFFSFQFLLIRNLLQTCKSQAGQRHWVAIGALGYATLFVPLIRETLTLGIKLLHLQIPKFIFLKHSLLFPPYCCLPVNAGTKIALKSFKKKKFCLV